MLKVEQMLLLAQIVAAILFLPLQIIEVKKTIQQKKIIAKSWKPLLGMAAKAGASNYLTALQRRVLLEEISETKLQENSHKKCGYDYF